MNNYKKPEDILVVKNLNKFFYSKNNVVSAVNDVFFNVKKGEIIGLIGESGSGKTTIGNSLIRLYDSYSGFVSLDGQIISGKKISGKAKKYLYKNMQMIFQDPHASLNPQKNIYSILKEPLIINKIMKKEVDDIFSDWKVVVNNFALTFRKKYKEIELENIKTTNIKQEEFLEKGKKLIDSIDLSKLNFENMNDFFNDYLLLLSLRQNTASSVVNILYKNNFNLTEYFFDYQKKIRNENIELYEKKLIDSKKHLSLTIELSKKTLNNYLIEKEIVKLHNDLKLIKANFKDNHETIYSTIKSISDEFRFDYLKHLRIAQKTTNQKDYLNEYKKLYLYKKNYFTFLLNYRKVKFINFKEVEELIIKMKEWTVEAQREINFANLNSVKKIKNFISNYIKNSLDYPLRPFINISNTNLEEYKMNVKQMKEQIKQINSKIQDSHSYHKSKYDIEKAKEEYNATLSEFNWSLKEFKKNYDLEMKEIENKITSETQKQQKYANEYETLFKKFIDIHNQFINKVRDLMIEKNKTPKKIKSVINFFNQQLSEKRETLKTFTIEINTLKKDTKEILYLLGIKRIVNQKAKIKDILLRTKIYNALEEVGLLRQFAWRYPHEFSGGQRQRIVIARALISNPKLIIADEPIASLDISIQAQIVNILKDLCKQKEVSLIFVAHDLSMVEYIADYISIMHLGKIVESGKTKEIYSNPKHPYTINLFNSIPKISNSNEKFKASNFDTEYLDVESFQERKWFKINDEHFLYSTVNQLKEWTNISYEEKNDSKNMRISEESPSN
ncbi:MAG: ATP-binding cassette domain-containing protein [Metamycoplasmataceae bacterium]